MKRQKFEKTELGRQAKGFAKHYYFFAWAFELLYKMYYSSDVCLCMFGEKDILLFYFRHELATVLHMRECLLK